MPAKRRAPAAKKLAASKPPPKKAAKSAPKRRAAPRPSKKATHGAKRDRHGNPVHFAAYLARLDDPGRDAWQHPDRVVAALKLQRGGLAAEIGPGTGQFAIRMAKVVGEGGRVYAIDVEPRMLEVLAERAATAGVWGIVGLLAPEGGGLPPEPVDVILMVNVFHHVQGRAGYLRTLASRLKPGGRIVIVDFHDRELPVGPPPDHKLSRADALAAVQEAGLRLVREERFLPHQYFLVVGAGR
jgi:SAM-dependent methyltransferase